jgi:hypothetical protein
MFTRQQDSPAYKAYNNQASTPGCLNLMTKRSRVCPDIFLLKIIGFVWAGFVGFVVALVLFVRFCLWFALYMVSRLPFGSHAVCQGLRGWLVGSALFSVGGLLCRCLRLLVVPISRLFCLRLGLLFVFVTVVLLSWLSGVGLFMV